MREKNFNCSYAEQVVSFLYGEIDDAEKKRFEAHLPKCSSCSGDLSDFSAVRSSVLEWRIEEFEKLSAPGFALPEKNASTPVSYSLLNSLRGFFAFNAVGFSAAAAMAAILAAFGFLWFLYNPAVNKEIVEGRQPQGKKSVSVKTLDENPPAEGVKTGENSIVEPVADPADTAEAKNSFSDKNIIPVKTNVLKRLKETRASKIKNFPADVKPERNVEKSHPKVVKNNLPILAAESYEDNSLRLSDILEEVSMK